MRIGIVVDSACDLPPAWLEANDVVLLPITVRIGDAVIADHRNEQATLQFLDSHVAERGAEAETTPFTVEQVRQLFLERLVVEYDYVVCMTITRTRSPIYDNTEQASFAILNDYKPIRAAAGHDSPFALRVMDTGSVFAGQGVPAVEAVRLRTTDDTLAQKRARLDHVVARTQAYMVPRDLNYLRARTRHRGDRSVSLLAATLGTALDIKPILHCSRGETGPVAKIKGFQAATGALFGKVAQRVGAGLVTPTVCLAYGGELDELRRLPGYAELREACQARGVELFESVMSLTGMVNVGKGSVVVGYAGEPLRF